MSFPGKIISGGQTGVDQGALDFALEHGMECGGWCPPGRACETGRIPDRYPLVEVEMPDYHERTRRNILDADATLVITAGGRMEPGTVLTLRWAEAYGKPCFHMDLKYSGETEEPGESGENREPEEPREPGKDLLEAVRFWMEDTGARVINVAGNREGTAPGIQKLTRRILEGIFGLQSGQS